MTVADWLRQAAVRLAAAPAWQDAASATPRREAEWVLAELLGRDLTWLLTWPEQVLDAAQLTRAEDWLVRRCAGEPLAYLAGRRGFWSLSLAVTPATLVPRPDTERLVELALDRLPADVAQDVLDLGTGSGAVALAIARERPLARVTAVDRCAEALAVAAGNGAALGLPVRWLRSDWFAALAAARFHVIVSNPPYLADNDPHLAGLTHEPRSALVADEGGFADLRHLVRTAPAHLRVGGWLLLEHGREQAAAVRALLLAAGYAEVASWQDYGGNDRVSGGRWPGDEHAE